MATACFSPALSGPTALLNRPNVLKRNAVEQLETSSVRASSSACWRASLRNNEQEEAAAHSCSTLSAIVEVEALVSSRLAPTSRKRLYFHKPRCAAAASGAQASQTDSAVASSETLQTGVMKFTHWEGNSYLLEMGGVRIAVDPIVGDINFGLPALVTVRKLKLTEMTVKDIPDVDCILITQGFDDHCHLSTLRPLAAERPNLPVIAAVNTKKMIDGLFRNTTYLEHGSTTEVHGQNGAVVSIKATEGDLLGPPWQLRENGYVIASANPEFSVYLEPHCRWGGLPQQQVTCVITPVLRVMITPVSLAVVEGMTNAVALLKALRPKYVVPLFNLNSKLEGILTPAFGLQGSIPEFIEMLRRDGGDAANAEVFISEPGVTLQVPPPPSEDASS